MKKKKKKIPFIIHYISKKNLKKSAINVHLLSNPSEILNSPFSQKKRFYSLTKLLSLQNKELKKRVIVAKTSSNRWSKSGKQSFFEQPCGPWLSSEANFAIRKRTAYSESQNSRFVSTSLLRFQSLKNSSFAFSNTPSFAYRQNTGEKKKTLLTLDHCISKKKGYIQKKRLVLTFAVNDNGFISPFAGSSNNLWKKNLSTAFYLLVAYKKTLRAKFNYYFDSETNTYFFLGISPFLAYFLQITLEGYDLNYQANSFIKGSLPQLKINNIQKMTWETFAYTKYSNKLKSEVITEINRFDNSLFISLNPIWEVDEKQFYISALDLETSEKELNMNPAFLSSRYFFQFYSNPSFPTYSTSGKRPYPTSKGSHAEKNLKEGLFALPQIDSTKNLFKTNFDSENEISLIKSKDNSEVHFWNNFQLEKQPFFKKKSNLQKQVEKVRKVNSRWQFFFNELDEIPIKLNSLFAFDPIILETKEKHLEIGPLFSFNKADSEFSDEDLENENPVISHSSSLSDSLQSNSLCPALRSGKDPSKNEGESRSVEKLSPRLPMAQEQKTPPFTALVSSEYLTSSQTEWDTLFLAEQNQDKKEEVQDSADEEISPSLLLFQESFSVLNSNYKQGQRPTLETENTVNFSESPFSPMVSQSFLNPVKFSCNGLNLETNKLDLITDDLLNTFNQEDEAFQLDPFAEPLSFLESSTSFSDEETWIDFLNSFFITGLEEKLKPLVWKRNFYYNLNLGISRFGKLPKFLTLATQTELTTPNLETIDTEIEPQLPIKKKEIINPFLENKTTKPKVDLKTNLFTFQLLEHPAFVDWKLEIKKDLKAASPPWVQELDKSRFQVYLPTVEVGTMGAAKNTNLVVAESFLDSEVKDAPETLKNSALTIKKFETDLKPLAKLENFEKLFLEQLPFKFQKKTLDVIIENPESILTLYRPKKLNVCAVANSKTLVNQKENTSFLQEVSAENKEIPESLLNFKNSTLSNGKTGAATIQNVNHNLLENSLTQRKLSGYLYPDMTKKQLFFNLNTNFLLVSSHWKTLKLLKNVSSFPPCFADRQSYESFEKAKKISKTQFINPFISWSKDIENPTTVIQIDQPLILSRDSLFSPFFTPTLPMRQDLLAQRSLTDKVSDNRLNVENALNNSGNFYSKKPDLPNFQAAFPNQVKSLLNFLNPIPLAFSEVQEKNFTFFLINPDSSLTSNQSFFFNSPTNSPIFKNPLHNKERKTDTFEKSELLTPYLELPNFIMELPSASLEAELNLKNPNLNLVLPSEFVENQEDSLDFLTEITKEPLFSFVMKENLFTNLLSRESNQENTVLSGEFAPGKTNPILNKLKQKNSNIITTPIAYKSRLSAAKTRTSRELEAKAQQNNEFVLFDSPLKKEFTKLYEPVHYKTWAILSQLGLAFILLKGIGVVKSEYLDEFNYYLKEFETFMDDLGPGLFQIQEENFRVIDKYQKKFSDLVGGRFLLMEFGDILLQLRNSRKPFSKLIISQPSPLLEQIPEMDTPFFKYNFSHFSNSTLKEKTLSNVKAWGKVTKKSRDLDLKFKELDSKFDDLNSKGILLIGPPGTGKTLLVQALAGEAKVPIIIESGKKLNSTLEMPGTERLKDLFKKARKMSPCLLFLDEIDTIGQKRPDVITPFIERDQTEIPNIFPLIYFKNTLMTGQKSKEGLLDSSIEKGPSTGSWGDLNPLLELQIKAAGNKNSNKENIQDNQKLNDLKIKMEDQKNSTGESQKRDLVMLTQLLCELDGLNQRKNIVVIGATNRPATLDPALIRPGRLGKVIYLDLPGKQKRLSLLKFYSHLGVDDSINWNYFANQTIGLSPAHLAAAMNRSALKAIYCFFYTLKANKKQVSFTPKFNTFVTLGKAESKPFFIDFLSLKYPLLPKKAPTPNLDASLIKNQTSIQPRSKLLVDSKQGPQHPTFALYGAKVKTAILSTLEFAKKLKTETKLSGKRKGSIQKVLNPFSLLFTKKKGPLHTFATMEYGIQTVSTMNQNSQRYVVKGKQTNKKTLGQFFPIYLMYKVKFSGSSSMLSAHGKFSHIRKINGVSTFDLRDTQAKALKSQTLFSAKAWEPRNEQNAKMESSSLFNLTSPERENENFKMFTKVSFFVKQMFTFSERTVIVPSTFVFSELQSTTKVTAPAEGNTNFVYRQSKGSNANRVPKKQVIKKSTLSSQISQDSFSYEKPISSAKLISERKNLLDRHEVTRKTFYKKQRHYLRTLALLEMEKTSLEKRMEFTFNFFERPETVRPFQNPVLSLPKENINLNLQSKAGTKNLFFLVKESSELLRRSNFPNKKIILLYLVAKQLQIVNNSFRRIIKNPFFGSFFLFNSTCLIKNSFFSISFNRFLIANRLWFLETRINLAEQTFLKFQRATGNPISKSFFGENDNTVGAQLQKKKKTRFSYYQYLSLNANDKILTKTFLPWQVSNYSNQTVLFGDSLFLNRSAYYLSGKSMVGLAELVPNQLDQPLSLWEFLTPTQTRDKRKSHHKLFLNKMEFESFLLYLIAGKTSENLMLKNQGDCSKASTALQKNDSSMGIHELKELMFLMNSMVDNYFFYSQKKLTKKQVNINFLQNKREIKPNEQPLLEELTSLFENQPTNMSLLSKPKIGLADEFKWNDKPWWQFNSSNLLSLNNVKYGEWYRLFLVDNGQNLRNIEWISPDAFFHNQLNNRLLLCNQNKLLKLKLQKEFQTLFINKDFVNQYYAFSYLNWNQIQSLELEALTTSFLFQSFNKIFYLLENHRELLDNLAYVLLCQENIQSFKLKTLSKRYFK